MVALNVLMLCFYRLVLVKSRVHVTLTDLMPVAGRCPRAWLFPRPSNGSKCCVRLGAVLTRIPAVPLFLWSSCCLLSLFLVGSEWTLCLSCSSWCRHRRAALTMTTPPGSTCSGPGYESGEHEHAPRAAAPSPATEGESCFFFRSLQSFFLAVRSSCRCCCCCCYRQYSVERWR